ncbi:MBOAT family protein [Apiospora rasikravindrae]|uniref:O-acyltransferase n=1 Tax=Apiospora rasikravindrae TaxID=990691 RepID=A0ABR1T6H0_9PEZI
MAESEPLNAASEMDTSADAGSPNQHHSNGGVNVGDPVRANGSGGYFPPQLSEAVGKAQQQGLARTPNESTSEEDYDRQQQHQLSKQEKPVSVYLRRRVKPDSYDNSAMATPDVVHLDDKTNSTTTENSSYENLPPLTTRPSGDRRSKTYVVAADDKELRAILRRGLEREEEKKNPGRREKLRDMVFTRQFSTFDRQNETAANSVFHGFYTLFWISVAFLILKMGADNWRKTGSPLGTNEIMRNMFRRDVIVLLVSDGVMCGLTGFDWVLQRLVHAHYIRWDKSGWIIQNVWQSLFIAGVIGFPLIRDWPWTHTVFFVLHGLVMLMKQHSYAFYNGHLSTLFEKREVLYRKLKQLDLINPVTSPSQTSPPISELSIEHLANQPSASVYKQRRQSIHQGSITDGIEQISKTIDSGEPLDTDQLQLFERMIKWEIDALTDELKGKAAYPSRSYPNNLTFANHYEWIVLPTLVYEVEYPRSEGINWYYVAEKAIAMFGLIFVMIMVSQAYMYPVVMFTLKMKEEGWSTSQRLAEFPWILSDLVFPFMMEYMLAWYVIWETALNLLAELTCFADRSFYDAWWNSVSWDQFARDWNRPVHNFLLRHVYHSSISSMRVNKYQATLITFFLSACVHELVMWCIFKKLRGYLLMMQMCQLPLVALSRSRWLKNKKTIGNMTFWVGIFTGPSLLCSLYLVL